MSNPQLSSNAASALISTINESPNTSHNNYVYSETDAIIPQQSMQWDNLDKSSGDSASLSSLHWDINKNGILTKMVLGLRFLQTGSATGNLCPNWAVNCISEINISSGGRVIQRMTREGIMAHISEQPLYVKGGYISGCLMDSAVTATAATSNVPKDFFLNLYGFWEKNKTALNTSFIQPLRVTVRFADFENVCLLTSTTSVALDSDYSKLYCQYRNLQDPVDAATIQSNYGDGLLSQLITTYSQENPFSFKAETATSDAAKEYTVNLKETSCIQSMYIFVMVAPAKNPTDVNIQGTQGKPIKINNIVFRANGNNFVDVPGSLLQLYGSQSIHGSKGFGATNWENGTAYQSGGTKYIYKIDFGSGDTDQNILSNLLSFRELASPQVIITYATEEHTRGAEHQIFVCYKRSELSNTVSSNGKYSIALSN